MTSCLVSHTQRIPNSSTYRLYIIIAPVHVSYVSTGTHILTTDTFEYFMDRIKFGSIWWKNTNLRPIGKPRITYCPFFFPTGTTKHLTLHPADNYRGVWMRATACVVACAPPKASASFWRRRLGYHFQPLLGGRRKPKNATHGTATAMQLSSKS